MRDLESVYLENFYGIGSNLHESKELKDAHKMLEHVKTLQHLNDKVQDRTIRVRMVHELQMLRSYIDELINIHQQKREG